MTSSTRNRRKRKRPLEFSKIIAIVMLAVFVFTFLLAWAVYIKQDKVSTELLSFISTPLMVIISGYFAKSGVENFQKINNNPENEEFNTSESQNPMC
jgi:ABC-type multidrug transport system permease subunit